MMRPENNETIEVEPFQPNSKTDSIEKMSPKRILSICRGIAQQSMAMPAEDGMTYRIANRDNRMIDNNHREISALYDEMEDNFESGDDYDSIVGKNAAMCRQIRKLKRNILLVKTTRVTSGDLLNNSKTVK